MRVAVTVVGLLVAGAAGFIEKDLAAGTLTIALAVWALLALFGLGQLFGAVRRSLGPRPRNLRRSWIYLSDLPDLERDKSKIGGVRPGRSRRRRSARTG